MRAEDFEEMDDLYSTAIRALQKLEVHFKEPMEVVLPVLKERRQNLRRVLEED